jgi:hypothetical protein
MTTRPRIEPCPSPNGTNFARKFLITLPRGVDPKGALDSAMRSMKHGRDADPAGEQNLAELRRELEEYLSGCSLKDEEYYGVIELLNEHLPKRYGDEVREREREADDEEERVGPDHEELARFAERHGLSDDAAEELAEMMPRNAREGGMGGRAVEDRHADDRRRRADDRHRRGADRRRMAGDSADDSFYRMFPEARRIGTVL